ncbi:MAG: DUF485 domain-containing protein [Methylophilaceae bacterium]
MKKPSIHWEAIEADPRFQQLHQTKTRFLWCLMLFALVFYFLLPISAAYFQTLFKIKLWGVINLGLIFALAQFVVAWVIAALYAKRANTEFDTKAKALIEDAHNIKGAA